MELKTWKTSWDWAAPVIKACWPFTPTAVIAIIKWGTIKQEGLPVISLFVAMTFSSIVLGFLYYREIKAKGRQVSPHSSLAEVIHEAYRSVWGANDDISLYWREEVRLRGEEFESNPTLEKARLAVGGNCEICIR